MVAVTPYNVLIGAGKLYWGAYGATEPADTAVNTTPASSAWTYAGATKDGATLTVTQEFVQAEVDQVADPVGSSRSKRAFKLQVNLAEATLANIQKALADASSITSGSGYSSITPQYGGDEMSTVYISLLFDAYAPSDAAGTKRRRRVICRKVLSVDEVGIPYKKDDVTVVPVTLLCHYVSDSSGPVKIVDESNTV